MIVAENEYFQKRIEYIQARLAKEEDLEKKQSIFDDFHKAEFELTKRRVKNSLYLDRAEILLRARAMYSKFGTIGFITGILLMIAGFVFWYKKVQNPLDKQLAQAVRETEQKDEIPPQPDRGDV